MRVGTVIKANRKQIGILVLFDGEDEPKASRHDHVINRLAGMTDLLDGRGQGRDAGRGGARARRLEAPADR
jgi:hypothetical protein